MMAFNRQTTKWILTMFLGVFILILSTTETRAATDVFVVYNGDNTAEKDKIMNALPKKISAKAYNVDFLAFTDYSGRNKALARMNQSKMIIILRDTPMKILKGARVRTDLLIAKSAQETVRSSKWTLYIVGNNANLKTFGPGLAQKQVSKSSDLGTARDLRMLDLLVVDEQAISLQDVISHVAGRTVR